MTDERLETRGESQQAEVANAPGRNFPPGTPFEIGELSRLAYAIGRSGMQLFASDLAPVINVPSDDSRTDGKSVVSNHAFVINVPSDDSRTDGKSVVSNHALRTIRDVLIWLTRNEPTEAAEPSEPAAVDRAKQFTWSLNDEEFFGRFDTDKDAIAAAVCDIRSKEDIDDGDVRTIFVAEIEDADEYLIETAEMFEARFLEWLTESVIHEFCYDDSPYDLNRNDGTFGRALVGLLQRHGSFIQGRCSKSRRYQVEITRIGWFIQREVTESVPAAEPAGETAR